MREKNTVTLEEIDNNKVKDKVKFKYIEFFKNKLLVKFLVCIVIAIIITLLATYSTAEYVKSLGCSEMYCSDEKITISQNYMSRLQTLLLTGVASVVPYFYMPYLGLIAYMYSEVITVGHVINVYGYLMGIAKYILPLILNICSIALITAVSVYIAKYVTSKFRLNRSNAMNFTSFRIKIYQMLKKQDKCDELYEKQQKKLKKLQNNIKKIEWKGVAVTIGIVCVIQFIAVLLEKVLV